MTELAASNVHQISNTTTPVQLLNIAVQQGADIDKLEKLMELQTQWESSQAKKAYHKAVSDFKSESIDIIKNKKVKFTTAKGQTEYTHATLDNILSAAVPFLAKHGLSHSWNPKVDKENRITVECILTHEMGHSERVELSCYPDDSGTKNNIQRVASAVTYLERYTFMAITGLSAKDQDDDGEATGNLEGFSDGLAYGMACYQLKESIEAIKDALANNDFQTAAEAYSELSNEERQSIWRAPSKGGIFSTRERQLMKSEDFIKAAKELIQ